MIKPKILAIIAGLSLSYPALAAESGVYLNPAVGYANLNNWWGASLALTLNGGYQYNSYFATEIGVTWIAPLTTQVAATSYQQQQWFGAIAAKGSLPLSDIFDAYIKGGLGYGYSQASIAMPSSASGTVNWGGATSASSLGVYMALGGELYLNHSFSFTFEDYGLIPVFGDSWGNINVFAVGARYTF
jgi:opacity protein-like surface antigen